VWVIDIDDIAAKADEQSSTACGEGAAVRKPPKLAASLAADVVG
jgi:hypothetical protein